jgi:hypothetical protein
MKDPIADEGKPKTEEVPEKGHGEQLPGYDKGAAEEARRGSILETELFDVRYEQTQRGE